MEGPPITSRRVTHGAIWFVLLSALGLLAVFRLAPFSESVDAARHLEPWCLLAGSALAVLDWILGAARIHLYSGALHPPLRFRTSFAAGVSNIFFGGVTPSQTGGGPAQIYVLWKDGMPFAAATLSSVMCFLNTILFLLGCAAFISLVPSDHALPAGLALLSRGTMALFAAVIGIFLLAVLAPGFFEGAFRSLLRRIPPLERAISRRGWADSFARSLHEYHGIMAFYITRARGALVGGALLTVLIYLNKFSIAWVVLRGLGGTASFADVLRLQMIQMLIFYFAPSPGASGVAEVTSGLLMGPLLPPGSGAVFTVLWRTFTLYLGMLMGGAACFRYLFGAERNAPTKRGA